MTLSERPAVVTCPYTGSGLSFATEAVGGLTLASGNTPAGCDVARNYEQLQFAACSHSEPDATDKTHLEVCIILIIIIIIIIIKFKLK